MTIRIHILFHLLAMTFIATAPAFGSTVANESMKVTAPDAAPLDEFGRSVAICGNVAIVGSRFDGDAGAFSGSAYLVSAETGQQQFKLTASDAEAGDEFGGSVAISERFAIVGARGDDDSGSYSGSAYVFDVLTGQQVRKLTAGDAEPADNFGYSVGISGTIAVVGARGDDDAGTSSGSAYLFDVTTGELLHKLTAGDSAAGDEFGFSVAICGDKAVVGARLNDNSGMLSGSAYVFDIATGDELFKLCANDAQPGNQFGFSVGISGNRIIVGSYFDSSLGEEAGSAYLFDAETGGQLFKLMASDQEAFDQFGISVDISGSVTIVGARGDRDSGLESGAAYLFDTSTGLEITKLTASDSTALDQLGYSVSVSGTRAFAGAFLDDDGGDQSGSAYLFDVPPLSELLQISETESNPQSQFGRSVSVMGTTAVIGAYRSENGMGARPGAAYLMDTSTGEQIYRLNHLDALDDDGFGFSTAMNTVAALVGAPTSSDVITSSGAAYLFDLQTGQQLYKLAADDAAENDSFGWAVAMSESMAVIGAKDDDDAGPSSGAVYLFDIDTGQQVQKLTAGDAASGDQFGSAVAVSGNIAVIGAKGSSPMGVASGAAYIFDLTTGQQLFRLLADDASSGDKFGCSVAILGNTVLVGAAGGSDARGVQSGSIYVFDATTGEQRDEFNPTDAKDGDEFGFSVSVSGATGNITAVVGSRLGDSSLEDTGAAYLFDVSNGQQLTKIVASSAMVSDEFGISVSISRTLFGTTIVVGAHLDDDEGIDAGSAYVFDLAGLRVPFVEKQKLLASDGAAADSFGHSVAISDSIVVVGAPGRFGGQVAGAAYVFDAKTGQELFALTPSDGVPSDQFGFSVAVSDSFIAVGSMFGDNDSGVRTGSVYLFDPATGQQLNELYADDGAFFNRFGQSVAISGNRILVGSRSAVDDFGIETGAAYLFDLQSGAQVEKFTPGDSETGTLFAWSVGISDSTAIVGAPLDDNNAGTAYLYDIATGELMHMLSGSSLEGQADFGRAVAISETHALIRSVLTTQGTLFGAARIYNVAAGEPIHTLLTDPVSVTNSLPLTVAISDDIALVGEPNDPLDASVAGAAYLFDVETGQRISKIVSSDIEIGDDFGGSVAISGDVAVVGAPLDDDLGDTSGSAYVFGTPAAPRSCVADLTADRSVDFFDLSMFISYFRAGEAIADFNYDGLINFFDFVSYLEAFESGCP